MVVSTLKAARKRTGKIRSNLQVAHRPICCQDFPWPQPGTDIGGATGAPWGRQTHQQVSLKKTLEKGAVDLPYKPVSQLEKN